MDNIMENIKSIEDNINNLVLLIDNIKNNLYNKRKIEYEMIISTLQKDIKDLKNSIDK